MMRSLSFLIPAMIICAALSAVVFAKTRLKTASASSRLSEVSEAGIKPAVVGNVGFNPAGVDAGYFDFGIGKFLCQCFGESPNGELCCAVRSVIGIGEDAVHAADIDDVGGILLFEVWEKLLAPIDHAPQINAH